ncbi:MAG: glutathione S-transferase family protein, partial [Rhodobacteraceae bacterium]|nr:glutathione S-transferase family protein [Paracoccaceae bacterium]
GIKVSATLEETGLPYEAHLVSFGTNDQKSPEFESLNPNGKIPAIIDPNGPGGKPIGLFETGAIMIYLAEKSGKLLSGDPAEKYETLQWLMWQMGGFGPMLGQAHHFRLYAPEQVPYAIKRYTDESARLYGVLDRKLALTEFVAGDYSIADMSIIGWAKSHEGQGQDLNDFANVKRWYDVMMARPAVKRALAITKPE